MKNSDKMKRHAFVLDKRNIYQISNNHSATSHNLYGIRQWLISGLTPNEFIRQY